MFRQRQSLDAVLVQDIAALECLRGSIACVVSGHSRRLVFLLDNAVQVGLCIARAIRDVADHRGSASGTGTDR